MKPKDTTIEALTKVAHQVIIHPVPGGQIIVYRYGLVFRVFLDCPEGLAEMDQLWVVRHRSQLHRICLAASEKIHRHGVDVGLYDS